MKIYIESLGCAKNQVDSEVLLSYALEEGYERTMDASEADLIVVNTCGFIQSAKEESINTFFDLHGQNPEARIVMAGCLAQRYGGTMELEEASAIFGNHDLSQFRGILKGGGGVSVPEYPDPDRERDDRVELLGFKGSAYLKIGEGCNHRCSFCAIPGIRGPLRSRPMEKVLEEAERLIALGIYEINVIAQDVASYGKDLYGKPRFVELMDRLSALPGNHVLRMLYIHPDTFPEELISLVAERKNILPYFDIPFQHGDKGILRRMGRTGDRESYTALVRRIRERIPDAVIRTTLMLGFPGETHESVEEMRKFIQDAQFDWMGSFTYSREEDTPAYSMMSDEWFRKAGKAALRAQKTIEKQQQPITEARLERFVGHTYTALVEEKIEGEELAIGRIYAQAPDVDGLTVIMGRGMKEGDVVRVGITKVRGLDLEGVRVDRP